MVASGSRLRVERAGAWKGTSFSHCARFYCLNYFYTMCMCYLFFKTDFEKITQYSYEIRPNVRYTYKLEVMAG